MDRDSLEKLQSADLEQLLKNDWNGTKCLPAEDILLICQILSDRNQKMEGDRERAARAAWERFLTYYWNAEQF